MKRYPHLLPIALVLFVTLWVSGCSKQALRSPQDTHPILGSAVEKLPQSTKAVALWKHAEGLLGSESGWIAIIEHPKKPQQLDYLASLTFKDPQECQKVLAQGAEGVEVHTMLPLLKASSQGDRSLWLTTSQELPDEVLLSSSSSLLDEAQFQQFVQTAPHDIDFALYCRNDYSTTLLRHFSSIPIPQTPEAQKIAQGFHSLILWHQPQDQDTLSIVVPIKDRELSWNKTLLRSASLQGNLLPYLPDDQYNLSLLDLKYNIKNIKAFSQVNSALRSRIAMFEVQLRKSTGLISSEKITEWIGPAAILLDDSQPGQQKTTSMLLTPIRDLKTVREKLTAFSPKMQAGEIYQFNSLYYGIQEGDHPRLAIAFGPKAQSWLKESLRQAKKKTSAPGLPQQIEKVLKSSQPIMGISTFDLMLASKETSLWVHKESPNALHWEIRGPLWKRWMH